MMRTSRPAISIRSAVVRDFKLSIDACTASFFSPSRFRMSAVFACSSSDWVSIASSYLSRSMMLR